MILTHVGKVLEECGLHCQLVEIRVQQGMDSLRMSRKFATVGHDCATTETTETRIVGSLVGTATQAADEGVFKVSCGDWGLCRVGLADIFFF